MSKRTYSDFDRDYDQNTDRDYDRNRKQYDHREAERLGKKEKLSSYREFVDSCIVARNRQQNETNTNDYVLINPNNERRLGKNPRNPECESRAKCMSFLDSISEVPYKRYMLIRKEVETIIFNTIRAFNEYRFDIVATVINGVVKLQFIHVTFDGEPDVMYLDNNIDYMSQFNGLIYYLRNHIMNARFNNVNVNFTGPHISDLTEPRATMIVLAAIA